MPEIPDARFSVSEFFQGGPEAVQAQPFQHKRQVPQVLLPASRVDDDISVARLEGFPLNLVGFREA